MQDFQKKFIEFAIDHGVLQFGEFTLKSGRVSPYFFNAGGFSTGGALHRLGQFYAAAIVESGIDYELLFGPAYKGIPLVSATAIALHAEYNQDKPYVFNRKEAKDHGEGGNLVGAPLSGRTLIIDDVITAGTAIREVMTILEGTAGSAVGVVVAIDREECGSGDKSAIQEVSAEFGVEVVSVVKLSHIVEYLAALGGQEATLTKMRTYQETYGVEGLA